MELLSFLLLHVVWFNTVCEFYSEKGKKENLFLVFISFLCAVLYSIMYSYFKIFSDFYPCNVFGHYGKNSWIKLKQRGVRHWMYWEKIFLQFLYTAYTESTPTETLLLLRQLLTFKSLKQDWESKIQTTVWIGQRSCLCDMNRFFTLRLKINWLTGLNQAVG